MIQHSAAQRSTFNNAQRLTLDSQQRPKFNAQRPTPDFQQRQTLDYQYLTGPLHKCGVVGSVRVRVSFIGTD
jgi:hypothetical protein